MIKYDMNKIMSVTEGDPASVMTIVHILTQKPVPSSNKDKT